MGPAIDAECKVRHEHLIDYDSYKRRVKALEGKREALILGGKEDLPKEKGEGKTKEFLEVEKELDKFRAKLENSRTQVFLCPPPTLSALFHSPRLLPPLSPSLLFPSLSLPPFPLDNIHARPVRDVQPSDEEEHCRKQEEPRCTG